MTTTEVARPAQPRAPGNGLEYVAAPDPEWRLAAEGVTCRHARQHERACGKPAVAEKHFPAAPSKWWAYCEEHLRAGGGTPRAGDRHWTEGGQVLHWVLLKPDGSTLTRREALRAANRGHGAAAECGQHHCPQGECPPGSSHVHSVRFRDDLWADTEQAAGDARTDVATWVRQAMEARLGYLRCYRCRETDPPVSLEFGDLTGASLGELIAEAAKAVVAQHPRHEPVTVGAETFPAPAAVGAIPFRAPAVTR